MEETQTHHPRSGGLKRIAGIMLTGGVLLLLLMTVCGLTIGRNVDFPCEAGLGPRPEIQADTRIAYCISFWPNKPTSGGSVYYVGSTNQDEVVLPGQPFTAMGALALRREDQVLFVNGQALQPNESYAGSGWRFTFNPWILATAHVDVTNAGAAPNRNGISNDALLVSGGVYEGWLPGPLGFIGLIAGIWLIRRGNQERSMARRGEA